MWKCRRPRPNHKGPPQLRVSAEVTQSIPPPLPSSPCWLCGCAGLHSMSVQKVSNMRVRPGCCDPTRHYRSDETLQFSVFYVTVSSRWCSVLWAISKDLLLFYGTDFLCTVVKYSKVVCERSNAAWIQNLRLFNECVQCCIISVRESLCYMLDRWERKGAFTAGK